VPRGSLGFSSTELDFQLMRVLGVCSSGGCPACGTKLSAAAGEKKSTAAAVGDQ